MLLNPGTEVLAGRFVECVRLYLSVAGSLCSSPHPGFSGQEDGRVLMALGETFFLLLYCCLPGVG